MRTQKPTRKSLPLAAGLQGEASPARCQGRMRGALFPSLDQLPRKPGLLKVEGKEAERPAQRGRLLVKDRPFGLAEEHRVEQRDAHRIKENANPSKRHYFIVLRRVAIDGKVGSKEGALVKVLTREGLEGGGAHHWKDQEAEREQVRQREQAAGPERRATDALAAASGPAERGVCHCEDVNAAGDADGKENREEKLIPKRPKPHA